MSKTPRRGDLHLFVYYPYTCHHLSTYLAGPNLSPPKPELQFLAILMATKWREATLLGGKWRCSASLFHAPHGHRVDIHLVRK